MFLFFICGLLVFPFNVPFFFFSDEMTGIWEVAIMQMKKESR